jgi:hypothetical protein
MSWESVYKIVLSWVNVQIFCPFIWSRVSDLVRFQEGFDRERAPSFVQISIKSDGDRGNDYITVQGRRHESYT